MVTHETAATPAFSHRDYRDGHPLAPARQRGLDAHAYLLAAEGGALTVREVASRLGVVQRAVEERRRAGQLLAFPMRRIRYVYPAWQFRSHGLLPGFEASLMALQMPNPWARAAFFLGKNVYLDGESPLAELRRGHIADVMRAVRAYGEHGAA